MEGGGAKQAESIGGRQRRLKALSGSEGGGGGQLRREEVIEFVGADG